MCHLSCFFDSKAQGEIVMHPNVLGYFCFPHTIHVLFCYWHLQLYINMLTWTCLAILVYSLFCSSDLTLGHNVVNSSYVLTKVSMLSRNREQSSSFTAEQGEVPEYFPLWTQQKLQQLQLKYTVQVGLLIKRGLEVHSCDQFMDLPHMSKGCDTPSWLLRHFTSPPSGLKSNTGKQIFIPAGGSSLYSLFKKGKWKKTWDCRCTNCKQSSTFSIYLLFSHHSRSPQTIYRYF